MKQGRESFDNKRKRASGPNLKIRMFEIHDWLNISENHEPTLINKIMNKIK